MKKTGVFYGSSTGTCEELANQIAEKLGVSSTDVHSVDKMTADKIKEYEVLVLGTSTWGDGELQDDWYDGVKVLKSADLSMKFVALFGCGDSDSYSATASEYSTRTRRIAGVPSWATKSARTGIPSPLPSPW